MLGQKAEPKVIELAAAGLWRCAAVVGRTVVVVGSGGPDMPASRYVLPLPPGGRVIALHADGPGAVTVDGFAWIWDARAERWQRAFNLFDEVKP